MGGTFSALGNAFHACPVATAHAEHDTRARRNREQERTTAWVATQLAGVGFRTRAQMDTWACTIVVETLGRALTADEHGRITAAVRQLWDAAHPTTVYEITDAGRAALSIGPCVDCGDDTPNDYLCDRCKAEHTPPDRSDLRLAGAA